MDMTDTENQRQENLSGYKLVKFSCGNILSLTRMQDRKILIHHTILRKSGERVIERIYRYSTQLWNLPEKRLNIILQNRYIFIIYFEKVENIWNLNSFGWSARKSKIGRK